MIIGCQPRDSPIWRASGHRQSLRLQPYQRCRLSRSAFRCKSAVVSDSGRVRPIPAPASDRISSLSERVRLGRTRDPDTALLGGEDGVLALVALTAARWGLCREPRQQAESQHSGGRRSPSPSELTSRAAGAPSV